MDADNKVLAATAAEAKVALSVSAESRDFMMKFRWEWTREKLWAHSTPRPELVLNCLASEP